MVPALDGSGLTLQVNRDQQPIGRLGLSLQRRVCWPFVLRYRPLGKARGVIVVLSRSLLRCGSLLKWLILRDGWVDVYLLPNRHVVHDLTLN